MYRELSSTCVYRITTLRSSVSVTSSYSGSKPGPTRRSPQTGPNLPPVASLHPFLYVHWHRKPLRSLPLLLQRSSPLRPPPVNNLLTQKSTPTPPPEARLHQRIHIQHLPRNRLHHLKHLQLLSHRSNLSLT